MKRIIGMAALAAIFAGTPLAAEEASLYPLYGGKTVKVHVTEIKNSTPELEFKLEDVRAKLIEALKNRKSVRFEIVDTEAAADLGIGTDLKGFFWTDHDPVDMIVGLGATAMDVALVEDYARVEADFTVTDLRKKTVLWSDRVTASITKKPMPKSDSIPLVTADLTKNFVSESFGKKKTRR